MLKTGPNILPPTTNEKIRDAGKFCIILLVLWPWVHMAANELPLKVILLFSPIVLIALAAIVYTFGKPSLQSKDGKTSLQIFVFFGGILVWWCFEKYIFDYEIPTDVAMILVVLIIATGVFPYLAVNSLKYSRIIKDTPTSRIRSAAQGYVELVGRGEFIKGNTLTAPLTGQPCIWYQYTIEKKQSYKNSKGKTETKWVTIEGNISNELFLLIDETGWVTIDPEEASVTVKVSDEWYGSSPKWDRTRPVPKPFLGFIRIAGLYRFREQRLLPGDPLYAIGLFTTVGNASEMQNIEADVSDIISKWKQESDELLKQYDANQNGMMDIQEWKKVRESAILNVLNKYNDNKVKATIHLLEKTCDSNRPFLLSALPQNVLVRKLGTQSFFLFAGFVTSLTILVLFVKDKFM